MMYIIHKTYNELLQFKSQSNTFPLKSFLDQQLKNPILSNRIVSDTIQLSIGVAVTTYSIGSTYSRVHHD